VQTVILYVSSLIQQLTLMKNTQKKLPCACNVEQPQSPWKVMQARQPLWSAEDEKRITEKREKERARYAHLPETDNEETDNEETVNA